MKDPLPRKVPTLMWTVYKKVAPQVNKELNKWIKLAKSIPDAELRTQALASIDGKAFHCYGGSIYALLAKDKWKEAIQFIVAYQTMSDYLDNLCDRSTSLDPDDFAMLHRSMTEALQPGAVKSDYYLMRLEQRESVFLNELVSTCQGVMNSIHANGLNNCLMHLNELYCNLQIHKHVKISERLPRLESWYEAECKEPELQWQEFAAASGSTLGIFCIISYALNGKHSIALTKAIYRAYFPNIQCLHIMLDYYIDQHEDELEGDLNFCNYYMDEKELEERICSFIKASFQKASQLPDTHFHLMMIKGLIGLYLSDPKTKQLAGNSKKRWLQNGGPGAKFFYWNAKIYCGLVQKVR